MLKNVRKKFQTFFDIPTELKTTSRKQLMNPRACLTNFWSLKYECWTLAFFWHSLPSRIVCDPIENTPLAVYHSTLGHEKTSFEKWLKLQHIMMSKSVTQRLQHHVDSRTLLSSLRGRMGCERIQRASEQIRKFELSAVDPNPCSSIIWWCNRAHPHSAIIMARVSLPGITHICSASLLMSADDCSSWMSRSLKTSVLTSPEAPLTNHKIAALMKKYSTVWSCIPFSFIHDSYTKVMKFMWYLSRYLWLNVTTE